MSYSTNSRHARAVAVVALILMCGLSGCSRRNYRLAADAHAYDLIEEKNCDPRWMLNEYDVYMDPRSRYFEPYDEDKPPIPEDDPTSHELMHFVGGMKGWKHWHDFGDRYELENPAWREALGESARMTEDGKVVLDVDTALALAYIHSTDYQSQLETLYLSAIDVTTERFRLDSQFFSGVDANFRHVGRGLPGGETNTLDIGGAFGPARDPNGPLRYSRAFAQGGTLAAQLLNSFTWEFSGGDIQAAASSLTATLTQPLLQGAGQDVNLERLTRVERGLLGNIRAFHRYRQGFYSQVSIGQGVGGLSRQGGFLGGTGLTGFTGQGGGFGGVGGATGFGGGGFFGGGTGGGAGLAGGGEGNVGGYIGLLQRLQQIRNSEASLALQLRTLLLLEAYLDGGVIDLAQVDQFRQNIETERANLLQSRNDLQGAIENYLTGTLGLPPDVAVELDDSFIERFQLVKPEGSGLQDQITSLQDSLGQLGAEGSTQDLLTMLNTASNLSDALKGLFEDGKLDLQRMEEAVPKREAGMSDEEKETFAEDRQQLHDSLTDLEGTFGEAVAELEQLRDGLADDTKVQTFDGFVVWLGDLYRIAQESTLIQARARVEAITLDPVTLDPYDAFQIALQNRLDIMNSRAALVDQWRLIAFNADALQTRVDIVMAGDIATSRDNPVSFNAHEGRLRAGILVDTPLTRLIERNNYRQSLIDYQRARRGFIQSLDGVHQSMRSIMRQLEQTRINLEIQRRAVAIAIRRVDLTREELNRPVPPPLPGEPAAQFGPTAATNLLTALSDLRNAQNNFMSVWLSYYATRMTLMRELGIMVLDEDGRWVDHPIPETVSPELVPEPDDEDVLPPPTVPAAWMDMVRYLPEIVPVAQESSVEPVASYELD